MFMFWKQSLQDLQLRANPAYTLLCCACGGSVSTTGLSGFLLLQQLHLWASKGRGLFTKGYENRQQLEGNIHSILNLFCETKK